MRDYLCRFRDQIDHGPIEAPGTSRTIHPLWRFRDQIDHGPIEARAPLAPARRRQSFRDQIDHGPIEARMVRLRVCVRALWGFP